MFFVETAEFMASINLGFNAIPWGNSILLVSANGLLVPLQKTLPLEEGSSGVECRANRLHRPGFNLEWRMRLPAKRSSIESQTQRLYRNQIATLPVLDVATAPG